MTDNKKYMCSKVKQCDNTRCYHKIPHKYDEVCDLAPLGSDISGFAPCIEGNTFCIPYKPNKIIHILQELKGLCARI